EAVAEEGAKRLYPARRDGQAGGHGVAAAGDQQAAVLGGEDRSAEIDARNRTARTFAGAVLGFGDDDGRAAEAFLETAGDDADYALMPAGSADQDERGIGLCTGLLDRLLGDSHFDCATLFVEAVELGGDGAGFFGIGGGQQAHAEVRFADPPAGVDSRAQRRTELPARRASGQA